MKKLFNKLRNMPKKAYVIMASILTAVIIPATIFAWGPGRQTFTTANPASYVTFNSITDNPAYGDERNFVRAKESSTSNTNYSDSVALTPGKQYTVYIYYHNNASSSLNGSDFSGVGVAKNAYVKAQIPAVVKAGSTGTQAVAYIGASNANPGSVWDEVSFNNSSSADVLLRYVPGSATIHNFGKTDGHTLSDNIVTSGASLGYDSLNGVIPGCNQYAGYVTLRVEADQPNFTITKKVRIHGTTGWKTSVTANPSDTVDYLLGYANNGSTEQDNVVLKDTLPNGESYLNGTTIGTNTNYPKGKTLTDDITANGVNIGNYKAGANAYVQYSAKIASNDSLANCGANTLTNTVKAETDNGTKQATADVTVNKTCKNATTTTTTTSESTPTELPQTGLDDGIATIIGSGSLVASAGYFISSRKNLRKK